MWGGDPHPGFVCGGFVRFYLVLRVRKGEHCRTWGFLMDEKHVYEIVRKYDDGTWDCLCPVCGRRVLINTSPYKREVIVTGDELCVHAASMEGMSFGRVQVAADHALRDWEVGLEAMGFDRLCGDL